MFLPPAQKAAIRCLVPLLAQAVGPVAVVMRQVVIAEEMAVLAVLRRETEQQDRVTRLQHRLVKGVTEELETPTRPDMVLAAVVGHPLLATMAHQRLAVQAVQEQPQLFPAHLLLMPEAVAVLVMTVQAVLLAVLVAAVLGHRLVLRQQLTERQIQAAAVAQEAEPLRSLQALLHLCHLAVPAAPASLSFHIPCPSALRSSSNLPLHGKPRLVRQRLIISL